MARDFDGVDDKIVATITAIDTGDWTIATWVYPDTAGEGNIGSIFTVETGAAANVCAIRLNGSSRLVNASQARATTTAVVVSNEALALGAWSCVIVTLDGTTFAVKIYLGTLAVPIAEATYASTSTGSGARVTAGVTAIMGNNGGASRTWDGRIERAAINARLWTLAEMEAFRLGVRPVQVAGSTSLRGYWPLNSPTASQAEDLSGNNAHGTVTGALVGEGPPVPAMLV